MAVLSENPWLLPAIIVVLGLFVYGLKDVLRISPGRIWAISTVSFRDAIRRRVLWITPLAMLGVVIISQLQKPEDQPDAIRQTIKFCFFASGLVVTIIALITAATNLPREIESRVVYTIVTKPVSRLEIILGKLVGFGRVSAAILLIMGVFTLGYLHLRAWYLGRQIEETLRLPQLDVSQRAWLTHFQNEGLLFSQTIHEPDSLNQYARVPDETGRWIMGGAQDALVLFDIKPGEFGDPNDPKSIVNVAQLRFMVNVGYEQIAAAGTPQSTEPPRPEVRLQILDERAESVLASSEQLAGAAGSEVAAVEPAKAVLDSANPSIAIPRPIAAQMTQGGRFIVQIIGEGSDFIYRINDVPVTLQAFATDAEGNILATDPIKPARKPATRGSLGRFGQQLRSQESGIQPVAVMQFRDVPAPETVPGPDGRPAVPFEMQVALERGGADADTTDASIVDVRARNIKTGQTSEPAIVYLESRKSAFFELPAQFVEGGEFDLLIRNRTSTSYVSLTDRSVFLVSDRESFGINLAKGLFVLWLFSLLVATVALFCSTFLSWPIAVVLAVILILGRWTVSNLEIGSGLGAQFANEFAANDPTAARLVDRSVETLATGLRLTTLILPDITPFGVTEQIERGATITPRQLVPPVIVLLLFGLPTMTLAYVFLRNKEVAP